MKSIRYLLTTFFLIQNIFLLTAQTTAGREFWVTYGKISNILISPANVNDFQFQIRIVNGKDSTSVTIFFTDLGTSQNFTIEPYEIYDYNLDNTEKYAVYNSTTGTSNYSIRITTSNSVSAYTFGNYLGLGDVTNLLPVTVLGTEYYNLTYKGQTSNFLDAYLIIATQDTTHLYHNNDSITTLNAGQVYYRTSTTDMTGALITSNNPIALFAVHQATQTPDGERKSLFQQMNPINTFGTKFFVPSAICEVDRIRIVVTQNGTDILQTGGAIQSVLGGQTTLTNLQAGDFVELEMLLNSNGCFIKSNYPIGVCSYLRSTFFSVTGCSNYSSSAQTWVPGIEQTISKVILAPFVSSPISNQNQFALVCTQTDTKDSTKVSIDGATPAVLSSNDWYDNAASGMSFYRFELTELSTSYIFSNPKGMIIFGYGTRYLVGGLSNYYYLTGFDLHNSNAVFFANDVHHSNLPDTTFCSKTVNFRSETSELSTETGHIKWYIDYNDGNGYVDEPSALDQKQWSKNFENGIYPIKMWVCFANGDEATITSTLKIQALWIKIRNVRY